MIRLPAPVQDALLLARHVVASVQRLPPPARTPVGSDEPLAFTAHTPLRQPDNSTCGSAVIAMLVLMHQPTVRADVLGADDPAEMFGAAAFGARVSTSSLFNGDRMQLPWPASLGTRPAALAHYLAGPWTGQGRLHNRLVDPRDPARAWTALQAAGRPVVMYVGDGSWMQHIVLVTRAEDHQLSAYEPACGQVVTRTREDFLTAHLDLGGWDQPWLLML